MIQPQNNIMGRASYMRSGARKRYELEDDLGGGQCQGEGTKGDGKAESQGDAE